MSSVRIDDATKDCQRGRTTVPATRGSSLAVEQVDPRVMGRAHPGAGRARPRHRALRLEDRRLEA
jgi:hypothetical protein